MTPKKRSSSDQGSGKMPRVGGKRTPEKPAGPMPRAKGTKRKR